MADQKFMKRMAPFLVLEILKNHTDEAHGLKVTQITELLEEDYGVTVERKTVSRILNDLLELSEVPGEFNWKHPMSFSVKFDSVPRSNGDIRENWRLCKEFEDGEIRLMTDLVRAVPGYPNRRLNEKLQRLGSPLRKNGCTMKASLLNFRQMPMTVDCIERAIRDERKMSFHYGIVLQEQAGERPVHTVSPYMTAFHNGEYYLVCYDEAKADMACLPVRDILDAQVTDAPAKDYHCVTGLAQYNYRLDMYLRCSVPNEKQVCETDTADSDNGGSYESTERQ